MATAREIFERQLERASLRALRAAASKAGLAEDEAGNPIDAELESIEPLLAERDDCSPMARLARQFDLNPLQQDFVWAAVAMVTDPRMVIHGHALIGSAARRGLPLSLYVLLAHLDGKDGRELALSLSPAHPLRKYDLLETAEPAASASAVALRASDRLVAYLAGMDAVDSALLDVGGVVEPRSDAVFDDAQREALKRLRQALSAPLPIAILMEGPDGSGRRTGAGWAAGELDRRVLALDARRLPRVPEALKSGLVVLRRECVLCGAVPLVANIDDLDPVGLRTLSRVVDTLPGPVVLTTSIPGLDLDVQRNVLRVDWPVPGTSTRRELWQLFLPEEAADIGDDLDGLSLRYRLGPGGIQRACAASRLIGSSAGGPMTLSHLIAGVRNNIAERLGSLARRIEVSQSWDDLVLSPDILDQVHALIARVRHAHTVYEEWGFTRKAARGIGVPVLFSGPPGTGKTMVAGIIANELNLELLQVDLSQVVSKWIGETEKQLSKVFDAAEAGHALLLFDEADALFAKRTEVKGATDRYANLEVNYLLQRVESFGGVTILTTNLEASIDKALKRRLASHVVFWPPDEEERELSWRRLLTTGSAPVAGDLDLEALAGAYPDMTGANIRNAVLAAAFLAASEDSEITQQHLERAARGEYRTMGRVLR